jgi:hypothetical protein
LNLDHELIPDGRQDMSARNIQVPLPVIPAGYAFGPMLLDPIDERAHSSPFSAEVLNGGTPVSR